MLHSQEKYQKEVIPAMREKFGYKNAMAVPRIEKVVINAGFGRIISGKTGDEQKKTYTAISEDLSLIAGQRPILTEAKKSIASFKIREKQIIGAKVTLRGKMMHDFIERLVIIALPRTRDFKGISPESVDKEGNLTIGIREQTVFPEILPEKTKIVFGFEVTVVTTAKSREESLELLRLLGFPIKA